MAAPESFSLDEVEDLEMAEVDGALLRQLLEEFEIDVTESKQIQYEAIQALESKDGTSAMTAMEAHNSFLKEGVLVQDFGWIDEIVEMDPVVLSAEAMSWYHEGVVVLPEFDFNDVATEEMAYSCLWDD